MSILRQFLTKLVPYKFGWQQLLVTVILSLTLSIGVVASTINSDMPPEDIAKILGWVPDYSNENLCCGYYHESMSAVIPAPFFAIPKMQLHAKLPATFSKFGVSKLQGDVTVSQPGREVTADKGVLYRSRASGRVSLGKLSGHVQLREYGKLIVSQYSVMDFTNKVLTFNQAAYRFNLPAVGINSSAWGQADRIVVPNRESISLYAASYSTCPPTDNTWKIKSQVITLDKDAGRGVAKHTALFIKNIPILYLPYFTFPIDNQRKSGLLYPTFAYSQTDALGFSVPYYFNLAPNYDLTLSPRVIKKRGMLIDGFFRYLTPQNTGAFDVRYIPHDDHFAKMISTTPSQYLTRFSRNGFGRGYLGWQNKYDVDPHWTSSTKINYVTDDNFIRDFGAAPFTENDDQLLNQVDVKYAGANWRFLSRVQAFQTLHLINQAVVAQNQYIRMPQLELWGGGFKFSSGRYKIRGQFINFVHEKDFVSRAPIVDGQRLHVEPEFFWPIYGSYGYAIPGVKLDVTNYNLRNQLVGASSRITKVVPTLTFDSGARAQRQAKLIYNTYLQTIEPRLLYLFVPRHDQSDIPLFDTNLSAFEFSQLFRVNRFTGVDRIGDANQLTLAVMSRYLDNKTGQEKMHFGVGQMYLFQRHKVNIDNSYLLDPLVHGHYSPVVGELQYFISSHWNIASELAWEPAKREINNTALNLQYIDAKRIFNLKYNFAHDGDVDVNVPKNLSRVDISLSWPIWKHWHIMGDWNYNISCAHPETSFYGIEYQSCCWVLRILQSKSFIGVDPQYRNTFDTGVYLQFSLKGLGGIGTGSADNLLMSRIPGYKNNIARGMAL